jgi:exonuclease SbcC
MDGFGTFRQPVAVSFDDTDFFALVGPTGSGKSTVIDALCFALYGSIPRYGDKRLVGDAMSAGHNETRVRLTFDVAGERFVAVRVVRRDREGRPVTREARLERLADGAVLAARARDLDRAVEELLGLPFDHFTRCVVLPQGEFARFLHDPPSDRQELLVRLLDLGVYEVMARAANRRAQDAEASVRFAEQRLAELAGATPEVRAAALAEADSLTALVTELDAAAPVLALLEQGIAAAMAEEASVRGLVDGLGAVRVPDAVRHLGDAAAAAAAAASTADGELAGAGAAVGRALAERAELPELVPLERALAAHGDLAAATEALERRHGELAAADRSLVEAEDAVTAAQAVLTAADEAVEVARQGAAAHLLAEHLAVGAPCPVCGQEVGRLPDLEPPPGLAAARVAQRGAQDALERARAARDAAARRQSVAATRVAEAEDQCIRLSAQISEHPDPAALHATIEAVVAADTAVAEARRAEQTYRDAAQRARDAAALADQRLHAAAGTYHGQRDPLVAAGAPAPGLDLVVSWEALATWAAGRLPVERDRASRLALEIARRRSEHDDRIEALALRCAASGLPPATTLDGLRTAAIRAEEQARQRVDAVDRAMAEAATIEAQVGVSRERAQVARQLGQLLAANRFERWLVAEALHHLVDCASGTLHRLSGGQYSLALADDGTEFWVIDHTNGDERRPVRTLSGGETFQASLSLALSLADELAGMAAGGAAKLDAIFLDEGFGTLDPDSLETVATTIESLGATGRMVGIVTHVRELALRVPVRYEVRRGPVTSTVERVLT